ncbi:MAG: flavin prenyltransferase UbiX [Halothiobacillaceae bacterium]
MKQHSRHIALAVTGASGLQYGVRLLEMLLRAEDIQVSLLFSRAAHAVAALETDWNLPARTDELAAHFCARFKVDPQRLKAFAREDWTAPLASGSNPPDAMVVCPCTTGTLAAISTGASDNLIERAADVVLKERRALILVPRETPYSAIHLEHMLKLARLGVVILPPNPGFYHRPQTAMDLVDFVVARILDHLDVPHALMPRWGEEEK